MNQGDNPNLASKGSILLSKGQREISSGLIPLSFSKSLESNFERLICINYLQYLN